MKVSNMPMATIYHSDSEDDESKEDIDSLYDDLPIFDYDKKMKELEIYNDNLKNQVDKLRSKIFQLKKANSKLVKLERALSRNISVLFATALAEIEHKNTIIADLRREKDSLLFRRERKQDGQDHYNIWNNKPYLEGHTREEASNSVIPVLYNHNMGKNTEDCVNYQTDWQHNVEQNNIISCQVESDKPQVLNAKDDICTSSSTSNKDTMEQKIQNPVRPAGKSLLRAKEKQISKVCVSKSCEVSVTNDSASEVNSATVDSLSAETKTIVAPIKSTTLYQEHTVLSETETKLSPTSAYENQCEKISVGELDDGCGIFLEQTSPNEMIMNLHSTSVFTSTPKQNSDLLQQSLLKKLQAHGSSASKQKFRIPKKNLADCVATDATDLNQEEHDPSEKAGSHKSTYDSDANSVASSVTDCSQILPRKNFLRVIRVIKTNDTDRNLESKDITESNAATREECHKLQDGGICVQDMNQNRNPMRKVCKISDTKNDTSYISMGLLHNEVITNGTSCISSGSLSECSSNAYGDRDVVKQNKVHERHQVVHGKRSQYFFTRHYNDRARKLEIRRQRNQLPDLRHFIARSQNQPHRKSRHSRHHILSYESDSSVLSDGLHANTRHDRRHRNRRRSCDSDTDHRDQSRTEHQPHLEPKDLCAKQARIESDGDRLRQRSCDSDTDHRKHSTAQRSGHLIQRDSCTERKRIEAGRDSLRQRLCEPDAGDRAHGRAEKPGLLKQRELSAERDMLANDKDRHRRRSHDSNTNHRRAQKQLGQRDVCPKRSRTEADTMISKRPRYETTEEVHVYLRSPSEKKMLDHVGQQSGYENGKVATNSWSAQALCHSNKEKLFEKTSTKTTVNSYIVDNVSSAIASVSSVSIKRNIRLAMIKKSGDNPKETIQECAMHHQTIDSAVSKIVAEADTQVASSSDALTQVPLSSVLSQLSDSQSSNSLSSAVTPECNKPPISLQETNIALDVCDLSSVSSSSTSTDGLSSESEENTLEEGEIVDSD